MLTTSSQLLWSLQNLLRAFDTVYVGDSKEILAEILAEGDVEIALDDEDGEVAVKKMLLMKLLL